MLFSHLFTSRRIFIECFCSFWFFDLKYCLKWSICSLLLFCCCYPLLLDIYNISISAAILFLFGIKLKTLIFCLLAKMINMHWWNENFIRIGHLLENCSPLMLMRSPIALIYHSISTRFGIDQTKWWHKIFVETIVKFQQQSRIKMTGNFSPKIMEYPVFIWH